jgi:hypothetical protein
MGELCMYVRRSRRLRTLIERPLFRGGRALVVDSKHCYVKCGRDPWLERHEVVGVL